MAPVLGAIFVPTLYVPPFAWEYTNADISSFFNLKNYFLADERTIFEKKTTKEQSIIRFQDKIVKPKFFLWEIERFYKMFLTLASKLYDEFGFEQANIFPDRKIINFYSSKGQELSVEFDQCWIINPTNKFINIQNIEPVDTIAGETSHLLFYTEINTDAKDAKALQREFDIENLEEGSYFSRIWWSAPFGPKKFVFTTDPKTKKRVITSDCLTFLKENVNSSDLDNDEYQIYNGRNEIFKILAPRYKRIKDRGMSFDRFTKRICLTTNLDIYENMENIKFIYYNDKSEIICKKNLNPQFWPESSQRTLMKSIEETIIFLLTNLSPRKTLF